MTDVTRSACRGGGKEIRIKPKPKLVFFFILCQLTFFGLSYKHLVARHSKGYITTSPVLSESRDHLVNSLKPYTNLRISSPFIATKNYLNTSEIQEYERELFRVFIHDYLDFHEQARRNGSRRLIFQPQLTGMGDTYGTLIFAYWAAVISRRVFLVDWQRPFPLEDFLQNSRVSCDVFYRPETDNQPPYSTNVYTLRGTKDSHKQFGNVLLSNTAAVIYKPQHRPPYQVIYEFVKRSSMKDMSISSYMRLAASQHFHRAVMHHVLQISDNIRKDQQDYIKKYRLFRGFTQHDTNVSKRTYKPNERPYIAVHARIGTGVGEVHSRFHDVQRNMIVPARCLASRAIRLSYMAGYPPLPIFLATDTVEFRALFRSVVKDISHDNVAVLVGDWDVVHSSRFAWHNQQVLGEDEEKRSRSWKKVWGSYMDLVMIGHAEHIVSLYSEFPRFAFALGSADTQTELRNHICTQDENWQTAR